jgi:hypothetical protein
MGLYEEHFEQKITQLSNERDMLNMRLSVATSGLEFARKEHALLMQVESAARDIANAADFASGKMHIPVYLFESLMDALNDWDAYNE